MPAIAALTIRDLKLFFEVSMNNPHQTDNLHLQRSRNNLAGNSFLFIHLINLSSESCTHQNQCIFLLNRVMYKKSRKFDIICNFGFLQRYIVLYIILPKDNFSKRCIYMTNAEYVSSLCMKSAPRFSHPMQRTVPNFQREIKNTGQPPRPSMAAHQT